MKQLTIHAFFDTHKGHEKQTKSILHALATLTQVKIIIHQLPYPSFVDRFFDWIRYFFSYYVPVNKKNKQQKTDIIIGTGSRCHIPMLLARKQRGAIQAKVITCMTPDNMLINKFDLCFVPKHANISDSMNIFTTNGPPCLVINKEKHDCSKGLILSGGIDHKSHYWQTSSFIKQVKKIIEINPDIFWTVSSSPRTPPDTVLLLEKVCHETKNAKFFRSEDTVDGWIEEQYDKNHVVWVTADSTSMVYEALSAGCRVGVIPVKWKKENNKFQRCLSSLVKENLITNFEELTTGKHCGKTNVNLQEAQRCAEEILRRWWLNRLQ